MRPQPNLVIERRPTDAELAIIAKDVADVFSRIAAHKWEKVDGKWVKL